MPYMLAMPGRTACARPSLGRQEASETNAGDCSFRRVGSRFLKSTMSWGGLLRDLICTGLEQSRARSSAHRAGQSARVGASESCVLRRAPSEASKVINVNVLVEPI